MGGSHGGFTTLVTLGRPGSGFAAAVALYPRCQFSRQLRPDVPLLILIGELDDWTPARPCVELGAAMEARAEDFVVTTYAGSHHAFDAPGGPLVHRTDVPNGVQPGQGVHVGPNGAAREAANASVRAFLRERLSH